LYLASFRMQAPRPTSCDSSIPTHQCREKLPNFPHGSHGRVLQTWMRPWCRAEGPYPWVLGVHDTHWQVALTTIGDCSQPREQYMYMPYVQNEPVNLSGHSNFLRSSLCCELSKRSSHHTFALECRMKVASMVHDGPTKVCICYVNPGISSSPY
jgi:hypothetical protein